MPGYRNRGSESAPTSGDRSTLRRVEQGPYRAVLSILAVADTTWLLTAGAASLPVVTATLTDPTEDGGG